MRILVVGGGGREHALVWQFVREGHSVIAAPGNPGIAEIAECVPVKVADFAGLVELAKDVDLVVVGPEDPLIDGLADHISAAGVPVYGPSAEAAQLEGSKAFSKKMMVEAGVPTARYQSFTEPGPAKDFASELCQAGRGVVVKASGNALGKGVSVCDSLAEADRAIDSMLVDRIFGDGGATVVVEERLIGKEFSILTICGDHNFVSLPIAMDHKRIFDGDQGPNTGGMGTVSPLPWVSDEVFAKSETKIVAPILEAMKAKGVPFRGTLFSGVLVQDGQPYCLEYNVRFGDPETQSVMRRLAGGLANALFESATGATINPVQVEENAAATVVIASGGYPGAYTKGKRISFGALEPEVVVFHAGTALSGDEIVTAGGRVLGVSATGATLGAAREAAYRAVDAIDFEGKVFRRDIGASAG